MEGVKRPALIGVGGRQRVFDGKLHAVPAQRHELHAPLAPPASPVLNELPQPFAVRIAEARRDDGIGQPSAPNASSRVPAEEAFRLAVPGGDPILLVDGDIGVANGAEDGAQPCLVVLERLRVLQFFRAASMMV